MYAPENSSLFTKWTNPASGVASYLLTPRAPVQTSFYFTNPSFTEDGRFLWVSCAYPPEGGRHATPVLGVVDFQRDEFHIHHDMQYPTARPLVDVLSGEIYWGNELEIWKRGPLPADRPQRVGRFPAEIARGRRVDRIATHLTFSADRKSLNLDARFVGTNETHIGDLPLDGSAVRIWQTLPGFYDHGLFSPTDPDLLMFAYEYWQDHRGDPFDGLRPYHRLWLIRRGEKAQPILREPVSHSGHEWWDADGTHIWYVHYGVGIKKVNLATREETNLWPGHLAHAYCDRTGRYLVSDMMADPVVCDCHVAFRDTRTGREIEIVNRPPLAAELTQCTHLHPHPQFCCQDRYICHTTTVRDRVDLALVPTRQLIE